MDNFLSYLEWLANGISDDGWKHLSNELIAAVHSFPLEWTSVMRKMDVACDYLCQAVRGDLPAEDESFEEDDDNESDDESESY